VVDGERAHVVAYRLGIPDRLTKQPLHPRHTYATVALDKCEDLKVVSDRLGHANMNVTAQIYTHRSVGKDRDAADRVAGLIFGEDWDVPKGPDDEDL